MGYKIIEKVQELLMNIYSDKERFLEAIKNTRAENVKLGIGHGIDLHGDPFAAYGPSLSGDCYLYYYAQVNTRKFNLKGPYVKKFEIEFLSRGVSELIEKSSQEIVENLEEMANSLKIGGRTIELDASLTKILNHLGLHRAHTIISYPKLV